MAIHKTLATVTQRIVQRSRPYRQTYLERVKKSHAKGAQRGSLSCTNLAHGFAAFPQNEKLILKQVHDPSIAIVSSYNDMLSAHQPFVRFPPIIKEAAREAGAVAQFAGGVPAMCDGITQGQPGMELSLFSRDTIAMATAIALSHNMYDAAVYLGICDKIVPGLLIGALHFGHIPAVFIPGGPMPSGLPNSEKARIRQLHAQGKVSREELLEAESKSYHSPGTCTFYGTANSNQMIMEFMGLHLPGAAFIQPQDPLRDAITRASTRRAVEISGLGQHYTPVAEVVDEKAIVNGIVALLATGGSTNHTLHLIAIAKSAGIVIDWDDFNDLSAVVPLLTRIYPNGDADVNYFHAAGGVGFLIRELLDAGLLHDDVTTILGKGLRNHCADPYLEEGKAIWKPATDKSGDEEVLRTVSNPFSPDGGLRLMQGNLGRGVIKVSAVKPQHRVVQAPAIVFHAQEELIDAYKRGELNRDFVAVVTFQGPRANGMPELHAMTPVLGTLQDQGYKVALVTDGRMSGASGKVPSAIHMSPEVLAGGPLGKVRTGDIIRVDGEAGVIEALVPEAEWKARPIDHADLSHNQVVMGRELFSSFRRVVSSAEEGAATFGLPPLFDMPEQTEIMLPSADAEPFSDEDTVVRGVP